MNIIKDNEWYMVSMTDTNSFIGQLFISRGTANLYIQHYKIANAKVTKIKVTEIKKKKKRKIS